jgi:hypothetical protein
VNPRLGRSLSAVCAKTLSLQSVVSFKHRAGVSRLSLSCFPVAANAFAVFDPNFFRGLKLAYARVGHELSLRNRLDFGQACSVYQHRSSPFSLTQQARVCG